MKQIDVGKRGRIMKKTRILFLFISFVLVFNLNVPVIEAQEREKKSAETELKNIRQQKQQVKNKLNELDKKLAEQKKTLSALENSIYQTDQQIKQIQQQLIPINKKLEETEAVYRNRLRILYQKGEMYYMKSLLEAESFSQFLERLEVIRLIAKQDYSIVQTYQKARKEKDEQMSRLNQLQEKQKNQSAEAKKVFDSLVSETKKAKIQFSELEEKEEIKEEEIRKKNMLILNASIQGGKYTGGKFLWPANGRFTSPFGPRWGKMHEGIDIAGPIGTPIVAPASGVVVESRPSSGYGWIVIINHGSGLTTFYAHSWGYQVVVKPGQRVSRGQKISAIGNNGNSTGPHLHFEVHVNGKPVDPMRYLR
jgi:murein DD-endopeptidase MepM/ murein hydrolase activator NlpD